MDKTTEVPTKLLTEVVSTPLGSFMILQGDLLGGHIKRGDPWEPHFVKIVQATVRKGDQVIDVGANFGLNAVVLATAVGHDGVVIAIEPMRVIFQQLCGNCFLNGLANVLTLHAAVGDTPGVAEMAPVDYFATGLNFGDNRIGSGGERVQLLTLDNLGLSAISFIKIDAQGSELKIIQGARQTIFTGRPVIFMEIEEAQLQGQGTTGQELIDCIKALGYLLIHIKNDYPVDYLCLPIERKDEVSRYRALLECPIDIIE